MPEIFEKDKTFTVIEYGENCSSFPLWDRMKAKMVQLIKAAE